MISKIALLKKATIFCVVLSGCFSFNFIKIAYSASYSLSNQSSSNVGPHQSLQASDEAAGQWSSVSNLISGGGFSQDAEETQTQSNQSAQNDSQKSISSSANISNKKTDVNSVSEPQFLQLQQLVIQLNKNINQLQQQLNTNIAELKQENYRLTERVQNLEIVARLLNVEFHTLKKVQSTNEVNQIKQNDSASFFQLTYQQIHTYVAKKSKFFWMTLIALTILILLLIKLLIYSHPRNLVKKEKVSNNMEEDEYDFMNSKDAIPAKFDLANAYIQMGNIKEAVHVLTDIIKVGTEKEKKKAQELLQKIQKKE